MEKRKILLTLQSILWLATALCFIMSAVLVYMEGLKARNMDPMADIYTIEAIRMYSGTPIIFLLVSLLLSVICIFFNVKDSSTNYPSKIIDFANNKKVSGISEAGQKKLRTVIFVVAVIFIILGFFNGSLMDVFIKASRICTECIGLG